MEAVGVADDPAQQPRVHRFAAEPQARPVGPPRLRLEVDVLEGVVLAGERRRRVAPEAFPRCEVLVEQGAALAERDAERLVLVTVPAHRRLHDEAALREEVERAELAREQQRMAQRRDHRAGGEPEPRRRGGDRREQHERARPRHRRILVSRHRVVARVAHDPVRAGARAEDDVLADHDGVEAGVLGDDGHLDERAQVARRSQRPVLAEHEDEPRNAHRGTPGDERGGGIDGRLLVRLDRLAGNLAPGRRTGRRSPPSARQRLDHGEAAERDVAGRVAALVRGDEAASAQAVGGVEQPARHLAEGGGGKEHAPERVESTRVEAAGDHDQLGGECLERGHDDPVERGEVGAGSRSGRQRNVERRAVPAPGPPVLGEQARACGVEAVLMERDREHGGVVPEDGLRAVAVVDVPVDDGDAPDATRRLRVADADGDVREEAEAHPEVGQRVVAGRADERVGVVDRAVEHRVDRGDRAARRRAARSRRSRCRTVPRCRRRRRGPARAPGCGRRTRPCGHGRAPRRWPAAASGRESSSVSPVASRRFFSRRLVAGFSECSPGSSQPPEGSSEAPEPVSCHIIRSCQTSPVRLGVTPSCPRRSAASSGRSRSRARSRRPRGRCPRSRCRRTAPSGRGRGRC